MCVFCETISMYPVDDSNKLFTVSLNFFKFTFNRNSHEQHRKDH